MTDILQSPADGRGTAPEPQNTDNHGMSARAKLVLLLLCAANFMVAVDFSILNIALPSIGWDLGIGEGDLQWVSTAFALPSGGFLLLAGRVGDLVGRKRVFLTGLVLFAAASLLAALAWDPAALLAARAVQGLGAALVVPTGMALLTTSFPEGPQRDRALGVSGSLMSLGFTVGVVLGGVLTQTLGWRSTMALNVGLGALVLAAAPRLLAESRGAAATRLDVPGAVTVTGGLLALIYALSTAARSGFGRPAVLAALAAGVALLALFLAVESRAAQPLVPLRVLRRRTVAVGNLGGLTTFAVMSSVIFLATLLLQQVDGMSPLRAGLVLGVLGLAAAGAGLLAPRLVGRFGAPATLVAGLLAQGLLTAPLALVGRSDGALLLATVGSAAAFGHLAAIVAYGVTATSGLGDEEQGLATGLVTTAQQVGLTVGIPLLSALVSARAAALLRTGHAAGHTVGHTAGNVAGDALLGGIRLGLGVDGAACLGVAVLVAAGLRLGLRLGLGLGPRGSAGRR